MKAQLVAFGEIEVDGVRYHHDVVIEHGKVSKRKKKPSKAYRERYGHTPLSADEFIPWTATRLVVGTGAYGQLPIMDDVHKEASDRGVRLVVLPTREACQYLTDLPPEDVNAILHATC